MSITSVEEFESLPINEKAELTLFEGHFVVSVINQQRKNVNLYLLGNFYVEFILMNGIGDHALLVGRTKEAILANYPWLDLEFYEKSKKSNQQILREASIHDFKSAIEGTQGLKVDFYLN